jgi:hypothetical protein
MAAQKTVNINGVDYQYDFDAKERIYTFELDEHTCKFKPWTWGDQLDATDESIGFDPASGQLRVRTGIFNLFMLKTTLIEMSMNGQPVEINTQSLRELDPRLGSILLGIAQWVNGIAPEEKKRFETL